MPIPTVLTLYECICVKHLIDTDAGYIYIVDPKDVFLSGCTFSLLVLPDSHDDDNHRRMVAPGGR